MSRGALAADGEAARASVACSGDACRGTGAGAGRGVTAVAAEAEATSVSCTPPGEACRGAGVGDGAGGAVVVVGAEAASASCASARKGSSASGGGAATFATAPASPTGVVSAGPGLAAFAFRNPERRLKSLLQMCSSLPGKRWQRPAICSSKASPRDWTHYNSQTTLEQLVARRTLSTSSSSSGIECGVGCDGVDERIGTSCLDVRVGEDGASTATRPLVAGSMRMA